MLPYTAEILFSSFAQYNAALWPLPLVALAIALAAILLALRPVRGSNPAVGALLAIAWVWTGIGYHIGYFAAFNFASPLYGVLFALQGLLLGWATVRDRLAFRFHGPFGAVGLALAALALCWPLVDWLSGQALAAGRVPGLAPAPTTVLTFGLLLLTSGRTPAWLAIIPLLWTLIAGATAWILWIPQDLLLPVIGLGGLGLTVWKNARHRSELAD